MDIELNVEINNNSENRENKVTKHERLKIKREKAHDKKVKSRTRLFKVKESQKFINTR